MTTAKNSGGGTQVNAVLKEALKNRSEAFSAEGRRVRIDELTATAPTTAPA